jgi:peptidoglycan hydrolase-like protein with peptidoglycan-binding domain
MRLQSFGFNPGPVDGAPGLMTTGAIMHYQQSRGLVQTGKLDRELLEQLRQDPAPQVAGAPATAGIQRATYARRTQSSDPFAPLRTAGDRFGQWLQSLTR